MDDTVSMKEIQELLGAKELEIFLLKRKIAILEARLAEWETRLVEGEKMDAPQLEKS